MRCAGLAAGGHLAIAQLLVSTFNLTAARIRPCLGNAIKQAGVSGHWHVIVWLRDKLGVD